MTTYDSSTTTYDSSTTQYDSGGVIPPVTAGTAIYTITQALTIKAGLPLSAGSTRAANVLAGTTGQTLVGALNILAGNPKTNYRELTGVLNQLAGTQGLGEQAAASRWAGN